MGGGRGRKKVREGERGREGDMEGKKESSRIYICCAQNMDLRNPWIALCKPQIRTLCGQSMDCTLLS